MIVESEINVLKEKYIAGAIGLEDLERWVGFWLEWDTMDSLQRRQFELEWVGRWIEKKDYRS